jgi:hypothetical protein
VAARYDGLSSPVTLTLGSAGVVTWPNHGLAAGSAVQFTTTGALPTGLVAGTTYYVTNDANLTANTFMVSDTPAQKVRRTGKTDACLIQGADLTRTLELLEPSRRFARA